MSRLRILVCAAWLLVAGLSGASENIATELSPGVWGVLTTPAEIDSCPGVILLHGASGWRAVLAELAADMADSGFVVLALDYYAEAGATAIGSARLEKWPEYQEAVRRAVAYMDSMPAVSGRPVGLVGFSRGAFLAVSVASSLPSVGAVVDYYGGGGAGTASVEEEAQGFPPLLILHGDADGIVPVRFAEALRDAVVSAGGDAEMYVYEGAGHAFNLPYSRGYSREAARDSYRRMMEFLERRLGPQ